MPNILPTLHIKLYLPHTYTTTPHFSFPLTYLHAHAAVMITPTHNPKHYNPIKLYPQHPPQLPKTILNILPNPPPIIQHIPHPFPY
ncbi:hypothetical protein [Staphylococcus epidermidis]|uniref:hypothetical protein n=1 Tax=Staphylococcus epidermidis TaxID=1282 RepID=UPI0011A9B90F